MYVYKIKYAVVVEDENGNFIETVTDEFFDTEEDALKFINYMNE